MFHSISFNIIAVLIALSIAAAQQISSGECPCIVKVIDNFQVNQYLGKWYEYAKYPVYFEGNGVCVTAEYTLGNSDTVNVKNAQRDPDTLALNDISGYAEVVSNAKLKIIFPFGPSVNATSNYWILGTDYDGYSVVYSCQNIHENNEHSVFVWILTRQPLPNANAIEQAVNVLKQNGISLKGLIITKQIGCNC